MRIATLLLFVLTGCGSGTQIRILDVPGTTLRVEMRKTHAHAFLAEYDFEVVLKRDGKEIDRANLGADTGGLSRIDVFQQISSFAFRSHSITVCVYPERGTLEDCEVESSAKELGHFDFDEKKVWRFIPADSGA